MSGYVCHSHADYAFRDKWAKTVSANKNIKVYIGAPASKDAAGTGYVDVGTLANFAKNAQKTFSSFGGVMLWEASLAVGQCGSGARVFCFLNLCARREQQFPQVDKDGAFCRRASPAYLSVRDTSDPHDHPHDHL